jgi:hypothetical protein
MSDVVKFVAAVCAPAMAIVTRLVDSADDRRERAQLSELNRLRCQFEGPIADSCLLADRVSATEQAT